MSDKISNNVIAFVENFSIFKPNMAEFEKNKHFIIDSQGVQQYLGDIFAKYYPDLFNYGCKIVTDQEVVKDHIQELFLEIWNQKKMPVVKSLKSYLLVALKYKLFKYLKKRQLNQSDEFIDTFEISHDIFLVQEEEHAAKAKKIAQLLMQLPKRQREILYLKFFLNLSYEEICDLMNINYQVARNQVSQAIKFMKSNFVTLVDLIAFFTVQIAQD